MTEQHELYREGVPTRFTVEVTVDLSQYGHMSRSRVHDDVQNALMNSLGGYNPEVKKPHLRKPPTHVQVIEAVKKLQPCTSSEVHSEVNVTWNGRTTVRNRLLDLVRDGVLLMDDSEKVQRFMINENYVYPEDPVLGPYEDAMAKEEHGLWCLGDDDEH